MRETSAKIHVRRKMSRWVERCEGAYILAHTGRERYHTLVEPVPTWNAQRPILEELSEIFGETWER